MTAVGGVFTGPPVFASSSQYVAAVSSHATLKLFSFQSGRLLHSIPLRAPSSSADSSKVIFTFSRGDFVYAVLRGTTGPTATAAATTRVLVFNSASGRRVQTWRVDADVSLCDVGGGTGSGASTLPLTLYTYGASSPSASDEPPSWNELGDDMQASSAFHKVVLPGIDDISDLPPDASVSSSRRDVETETLLPALPLRLRAAPPPGVRLFAASPLGDYLAWVTDAGSVGVLDVRSGIPLGPDALPIDASTDPATALSFGLKEDTDVSLSSTTTSSPLLCVGTQLGRVYVFGLRRRRFWESHWHPVRIRSVSFSSDGSYVYSSGDSGVVLCQKVSTLGTRREERRYVFVREKVGAVRVSGDQSRYVVQGLWNGLLFVAPSTFRYHGGVSGLRHALGGVPPDATGIICASTSTSTSSSSSSSSTSSRKDNDDDSSPSSSCDSGSNSSTATVVCFSGTKCGRISWYDVGRDREVRRLTIFKPANAFDPHSYALSRPAEVTLSHVAFSCGRSSGGSRLRSDYDCDYDYDYKWMVSCEEIRGSELVFRRSRGKCKNKKNKKSGDSASVNVSVNLKVWKRTKKGTYGISAVIDSPHADNAPISCLDIASASTSSLTFATGGEDCKVRLWRQSGGSRKTGDGDGDGDHDVVLCYAIVGFRGLAPSDVRFSPDATVLIAAFGSYLTLWDPARALLLHAANLSVPLRCARFMSSKYVIAALGVDDGISPDRLILFDVGTLTQAASLTFEERNISIRDVVVSRTNTKSDSEAVVILRGVKEVCVRLSLEPHESSPLRIRTIRLSRGGGEIISAFFSRRFHGLVCLMENRELRELPLDDAVISRDVQRIKEEAELEDEDAEVTVVSMPVRREPRRPPEDESFDCKVIRFDPREGLGAWKPLFAVPTHSLNPMSEVYESFMQTFVVKRREDGQ